MYIYIYIYNIYIYIYIYIYICTLVLYFPQHSRDIGGSGREVENENEGWGVETTGGDGSEMGRVMKKENKMDDRYRYQPHPGFPG